MIRASGLTLARGTKILLRDTEFVVHPGERIGIVGRNGAGKSTLFSLLRGEIDADAGELSLPADWRIASVAQEIAEAQRERPAREFVIDGDTTLRALQAERAGLTDGQRIAELEAALADAGAWDAASRAEQLLAGLGFAPSDWMAPVRSFSGGWQMRLSLARALMAPSELLLLDEPTNHLDLDAMLWLERWLQSYPGAVLLISHDTEFLDAVATAILHFDQQRLVRYRGRYQDFLSQRAERLRQTQLAHERQQRESARLQSFIDRFRAKASKAKQAQSRVKALARMQVLAPLQSEHGVQFSLPEPTSMPDPLLTLREASLGYPADGAGEARPVLAQVTLALRGGARIGVLGVNGAGKSTLIRSLVGDLTPLAGERHASRSLEAGYFAQHQLDMLRPDESPLQHLARQAPDEREQVLRNYLGGFGFSGEAVHHAVHTLSGGEKAKLALALIVWRRPNLLLLDEPSNHLDVETRSALAEALAGYEGSVLLVSHDRHLLRSTVDEFWIVADGQVQAFDGDLDDYREWLAARAADQRAQARGQRQAGADPAPDRRAQRRQEAEQRQRLARLRKPLEQKLQRVEADMAAVAERLRALDAAIASPDFYDEAQRQARPQVLAEHGELGKRQAELENAWLELQEALEDLARQAEAEDA